MMKNNHFTNKKNRNYWLDLLRGFSAIWVVLFHLNIKIPNSDNLYYQFVQLGYLGVPIFFIVSGYCIQLTAQKSQSLINFYWRRFSRIYPPYLASILVVMLAVFIIKWINGVNDVARLSQNLTEWLITLTAMTSPATSVPTINWVYWSLTYEILFYFIIGITLVNKRYSIHMIYIITLLSFVPGIDNTALFFLDRWSLFLLGIALYEIVNSHKNHGYTFLFMSMISMFIEIFYGDKHPLIHGDPSYTSVTITSLLTFISILLSFKYQEILSVKNWLSRIGEMSYSLYLIHVPIACYLLLPYRQGIWFDVFPLHLISDLFLLSICLFLSVLFFHFVEKPAIALGRYNLKIGLTQLAYFYRRLL